MKETERTKVVAARYELEKLLGQGGMGEVWVAKDLQNGGKIALKLLKAEAHGSKEQRGRFEREARIAGSLVSPHITRVSDSGVDEDGTPFMALELLEGEDLQKRIKTEKVLPIQFVVRLAIQVGRALHVAHAAGLVHRDLKPANIFLARQNGEEIAKVLDFGIAKGAAESSEFTTAGEMLGTASYMSPEQIRNAKTVTHQADLWALAVVLFRSLTGEFPFVETGFDLFLALTQDPLPTPRRITSLVPALPAPLNVFFERAFTRDVTLRYPNASAMIVGFCRASGVTVPQDILSAADSPAPMPMGPVSGQYPAVQPPSSKQLPSGQYPAVQPPAGHTPSGQYRAVPPSGPVSGAGPYSQTPPRGQPLPNPVHEPAPQSEPIGLSGTLMLDSMPDLAASLDRPRPAAGLPALGDLDPDEPDNASTLFYQPGAQAPMDIRPGAAPPASGFGPSPDRPPQTLTAPLDTVRAAAAAEQASQSAVPTQYSLNAEARAALAGEGAPRRPSRSAGLWVLLVVVILLGGAAFAVLFLMKG